MFWANDVDVRNRDKGDNFIDGDVCADNGLVWRITGLYGWPDSGQKFRTWEMINMLARNFDGPWLVGGDFNEVLKESEKNGGSACDFNNLCAFRDCLHTNDLRDIVASGHPYTWRNNRQEGFIEERLDRFVANSFSYGCC